MHIRTCKRCGKIYRTIQRTSKICEKCYIDKYTPKKYYKKKTLLHYQLEINKNRKVYLCNWACNTTKDKLTKNKKRVTCKNCLRLLKNNNEKYL